MALAQLRQARQEVFKFSKPGAGSCRYPIDQLRYQRWAKCLGISEQCDHLSCCVTAVQHKTAEKVFARQVLLKPRCW